MKAIDLAKKYGYKLKIVTSMGLFDHYDACHNIFEQFEEPCRRIVIMTKDENLQEVYETEIHNFPIINLGNIWIKPFPLITPIENINIDSILLNETEISIIETAI